MSGDDYNGSPEFTVQLDGHQLGGTQTVAANHRAQQTQEFVFNGTFATGTHTLVVTFVNDAWGGAEPNDRNLFIEGVSFEDGAVTHDTASLYVAGSATFAVRTADNWFDWTMPAFDPSYARNYGYKLVFDTEFNSAADIDFSTAANAQSGHKFYGRMFDVWGGASQSAQPSRFTVTHGVLHINGGQISTIAPGGSGYVGTTFAGGGYFEARVRWNRTQVRFDSTRALNNLSNWWPSFYSVPAEYFTSGKLIPGTNEAHFVENDWFEAWPGNEYGATLHDWFGPKGCYAHAPTDGQDYCDIANSGFVTLPNGSHPTDPTPYGQVKRGNAVGMGSVDPTGFHTIGALWVSADYTPDHIGYAAFYFDGRLVGEMSHWIATPQNRIPPTIQTVFSELDHDHNVIFIGAPATSPLDVDWIHVWQLNTPISNQGVQPEPGFTGANGAGH